ALGALLSAYLLKRRLHLTEMAFASGWVLLLVAASAILYLPFKSDYQTVFTTGVGLTRDAIPQLQAGNLTTSQIHEALVTPLRIYLEHFGLFAFVTVSLLLLLVWKEAGFSALVRHWTTYAQLAWYYRDRLSRLRRSSRIVRRVVR